MLKTTEKKVHRGSEKEIQTIVISVREKNYNSVLCVKNLVKSQDYKITTTKSL